MVEMALYALLYAPECKKGLTVARKALVFPGGPSKNRTRNQLIKSQLLYLLS